MSQESNYTGRIFWRAEVLLASNATYIRRVTRADLSDFLKNLPLEIKQQKDVDIINKYVIPYVHFIFKNYIHEVKCIIVRKHTTI